MDSSSGNGLDERKSQVTHLDLIHSILFALFFSWLVTGKILIPWRSEGWSLSLVPWLILAPIGPLVLAWMARKWFRTRKTGWFTMSEAFGWRMREYQGANTPGDQKLVLAKSWSILIMVFAGALFCVAYLVFGLVLGRLDASLAFFTCATFLGFLAHLHSERLFLQRVWWDDPPGLSTLGIGLLIGVLLMLVVTFLAWMAHQQDWTLPFFVPLNRMSG